MQSPKHSSRIITFFVGFLFLFAMIFLCKGDLHFWHQSGPHIFPFLYWRRIFLGAGILLGFLVFKQRLLLGLPGMMTGLFGILLIFCSDWLDTPYSILRGPNIRGEILLASFLSYALLKRGRSSFFSWVGPITALGLIATLLVATQGRLIFSDDHPVFLQRLILLKENFPWIPFYNPLWNAGIDQRDFFATGALGVFLVLAPLVYAFDITQHYTQLIAVLLFMVVPAGSCLAIYRCQKSRLLCSISTILTLSNSLLWYRWALKYGTVGFLLSSSLIPLVLVLGNQYLDKKAAFLSRDGFLLVIVTTLMLLWSPTALVFLPLGLLAIFRLSHLLTNKTKLFTALTLVAINIAWMSIFISVSRVGNFVAKETTASRRVAYSQAKVEEQAPLIEHIQSTSKAALKVFRDWASTENPLILMFCLPGMLLLRNPLRLVAGLTITWSILLGTFGSILLPQLELDRMLLIAGLIAIIPVSLSIEYLIVNFSYTTGLARLLSSLSLGFLTASPFATASILLNRSVEHYEIAKPIVQELSDAVRAFGGTGRTVFSGFILHELSGGHIAPLVFWSGKELVASSHVHDKWQYTNVIPETFATKGDSGIEEYLDLMNATAIVAHEKNWIRYFQERHERYHERWRQDRFVLFERTQSHPSFFISGNGSILQVTSNSVTVTSQTPEAIIKYRYYPFLRASACQISPYLVEDLSFIKLSNCPINTPIEISAKTGWYRIG